MTGKQASDVGPSAGALPAADEGVQADGASCADPVALLSALVDSVPDLFWAVDARDFGLLAYNPALAADVLRRCGRPVAPGQPPEALWPDDAPGVWRGLFQRALDQGDFALDHVDGDQRTFELRLRRVRQQGQVLGVAVYARDVTQDKAHVLAQRRHLEEALSASESHLRVALASAKAGTWELNLLTNEITWSDDVWNLYDLDRQSTRPSAQAWFASVHPDDLAATVAAARAVFGAGDELSAEWRVNTRDGRLRWLMARGRPELDGSGRIIRYLGIVVDITERKQMLETLRLSEEKYRNLFHNAEVGMFRTRVDGAAVLDFNEKYLQIYGLRREEMLGRPVGEYWVDLSERTALVAALEHRGRVTDFECRMRTKNGEVRTCLASARLYPEQGVVEGTIIDITDRKRAEEERLRLEQQLSQAQRLESLGLLAGGIAHDFNNLMTGIYGHIELAMQGPIAEEPSLNLSHALSSMRLARALTRQLLTFAKGGAPMRTVGRLFPFVEESARFALSGSRASCTVEADADLWRCSFDQNQLGQVVGNLVINALQAGATAIRISARNLRLEANQVAPLPAGDYAVVSIADDGSGIPAATLPMIFDPFFTTKKTGRGLGLSTCHSIMRRHQGAIRAESTPGRGSIFHVYLPASDRMAAEVGSGSVPAMHKGKGTVLVMDDDRAVRDVLTGMLATLGYATRAVPDGNAALVLFEREREVGQPFCAVLLDLTVAGGMGGRETAQRLRMLDSHVPIFVTSGYAEDPVMEDPAAHGFRASLRKPFSVSDLSQLFERHVRVDASS